MDFKKLNTTSQEVAKIVAILKANNKDLSFLNALRTIEKSNELLVSNTKEEFMGKAWEKLAPLVDKFTNEASDAFGFNEMGVRFGMDHLNAIYPAILGFNIYEQAAYVDQITMSNTTNNDWLKDQLSVPFPEKPSNSTAVGNLAYIALNAGDEKIRNKVLDHLNTLREEYQDNQDVN